jgi:hypothetical protein
VKWTQSDRAPEADDKTLNKRVHRALEQRARARQKPAETIPGKNGAAPRKRLKANHPLKPPSLDATKRRIQRWDSVLPFPFIARHGRAAPGRPLIRNTGKT